jgi:outer membrane cobalamin receptor
MPFFTLIIALLLNSASPDEIVVVGKRSRKNSAKSEKSSFTRTIKTKKLMKTGGTIGRALAQNPGLDQKTTGGMGHLSLLMIRGSTPSQVSFFMDGFRLNSGGGAIDLSGLPLAGVSKIEVFKSSIPAELGVEGIGGAVNIILLTPKKRKMGVYYSLGSFGTMRKSMVFGIEAPIPFIIAGSFTTTLGNYPYFDNNGTEYTQDDDTISIRSNNGVSQGRVLLGTKFNIPGGKVRGYGYFSKQKKGVPGPGSIVTRETSYTSSRAMLMAKYIRNVKNFSMKTGVSVGVMEDHYENLLGELGIGIQNDKTRSIGSTVNGSFSWNQNHHLFSLLPEFRYEKFDTLFSTAAQSQHLRRLSSGVGVRYRFVKDDVFLQGVYQFLHFDNLSNDNYPARNLQAFKVGAAWSINKKLRLKLNFASAFRVPSFIELFGNSGALKGNSSLLSEESKGVDGGAEFKYRWKNLKISGEISVFGRKVHNLIQYIPNSQYIATAANIANALIYGVETSINMKIFNKGKIILGLTKMETENNSILPHQNEKELPGRAKWIFSSNLSWKLMIAKFKLVPRYRFSLYKDGFFDSSERRPMPSRNFHDLILEITPSWKGVFFSFEIRNISNDLYEMVERLPVPSSGALTHPQSISNYLGYPIPGRSYIFNISLEL